MNFIIIIIQRKMGTSSCFRPENNSEVYAQMINKIYQEVDKSTKIILSQLQQQLLLSPYTKIIKPSITKKGILNKLIDHLSSHKNKLIPCIKFITNFQIQCPDFSMQFHKQSYYKMALLLLQHFSVNLQILMEDFEFKKTSTQSSSDLKHQFNNTVKSIENTFGVKNAKKEKMKLIEKKIYSQNIVINFEKYIINMISNFSRQYLEEDQKIIYLESVNRIVSYRTFKFQKQSILVISKLFQDFFENADNISYTYQLLFLIVYNLINKLNQDCQNSILCMILSKILKFTQAHQQIIKISNQIRHLIKQIIQIYENLLKQSKHIQIYKVLIQLLNSNIEQNSDILFVFQYNTIVLFILFNCLITNSNITNTEQIYDELQNLSLNNFIDIKKYNNLTNVKNKQKIFNYLLKYIRFGFQKKREMFIIPINKLIHCLLANINMPEVKVQSWVESIKQLLKLITVEPYKLFKEFINSINERSHDLNNEVLYVALKIVNKEIKKQLQLDSEIFNILDSPCFQYKMFQLHCNYVKLEIINQILKHKSFFQKEQIRLFQENVANIIKNILKMLEEEYQGKDLECISLLTPQIINFFRIVVSYKLQNFLFIVIQKIIILYEQKQLNYMLKIFYYDIIIDLMKILEITVDIPSQSGYLEVKSQIEKINQRSSNKQSINTTIQLAFKINRFKFIPITWNMDQMIKNHPKYNQIEYRYFMTLINLIFSNRKKSYKEQEEEFVWLNRHSYKEKSNSTINEGSFAQILQVIKKQ